MVTDVHKGYWNSDLNQTGIWAFNCTSHDICFEAIEAAFANPARSLRAFFLKKMYFNLLQ
jgi:hypothetical protein